MKKRLFLLSQYLLPHHLLSRLAGCIAECRVRWFKNAFTSWFAKRYQVDMSQALVEDVTAYEHFNAFFTRALKDGARPLDQTPGAVLSPADGAVSQLGPIEHGRVFQAKGHSYSVLELVGGDAAVAAQFMGGEFATIYLSPKDYHRVHMPLAGTLREMIYVPGRLFSVNQTTAENVPELFARNELVLLCSPETELAKTHPNGASITLSDAAGEAFVLLEREHHIGQFLREQFRHNGMEVRVMAEVNSFDTAMRIALSSGGVTLSPYPLFSTDTFLSRNGNVYFLSDVKSTHHSYICWRKNQYLTQYMKDWIDLLASEGCQS